MFFYPTSSSKILATNARRAARTLNRRAKQEGKTLTPAPTVSKTFRAQTYWSTLICDIVENLTTDEARLTKGRTYLYAGTVLHLAVEARKIEAIVRGGETYQIQIDLEDIPKAKKQELFAALKQAEKKKECGDELFSCLFLLLESHLKVQCSCPDQTRYCKHIVAVLYALAAKAIEDTDIFYLFLGMQEEDGGDA